MNNLILLGRGIFIFAFAGFGFLHFGPLEFSLPYVPAWLPFPAFWVYFVGICFFAFVISATIKKFDRPAALMLALCMFLFVVLVHIPTALSGDFKGVIAILRDLAMSAAALMYAGLYTKERKKT